MKHTLAFSLLLLLTETFAAMAADEFEVISEGLSNPTGVAIQPGTGHVFVAESAAGRVIRIVDGQGSVLPEEWGGPASSTVLSPMLQHVERASQQAKGAMQQVIAHYIELEPQGEEMIPGDIYSTLDYHAVAVIDGERVDSTQTLQHGQCSCGSCPG